MTDERKETVGDVVREMLADGESPPSDPRDSSIQNILRPWRKAMKDRAARIEAAHAREIAEKGAEIEMRDDILEGWKNGAKQKDAEIERLKREAGGYRIDERAEDR